MTRKMRTMEPKDDTRPMMTPVKAEDGDVVIAEGISTQASRCDRQSSKKQHSLAAKEDRKTRNQDSEEPD
jgi:hypothetical protein